MSRGALLGGLLVGLGMGFMIGVAFAFSVSPVRTVERVVQVPVVRMIECSRADLVDSVRPYDEPGVATKGGTK